MLEAKPAEPFSFDAALHTTVEQKTLAVLERIEQQLATFGTAFVKFTEAGATVVPTDEVIISADPVRKNNNSKNKRSL